MKRKIHNQIRFRKFRKKLVGVLLYSLQHILPIIVLLGALYASFKLICIKGYNTDTGIWDIDLSFSTALACLGGTALITILATILCKKIADSFN